MKFTAIIPSRDRPALFKEAIDSVLMQRNVSLEVVVVNDGSSEIHLPAYREIAESFRDRARFIYLDRVARGHGQSFALNLGAVHATGDYLCFLDDDDYLTDPSHLARAQQVISTSNSSVDLYFANQQAYADGKLVEKSIWIDDLLERMWGKPTPDSAGGYTVTVDDLLKCSGFAHLNTTLIRREHFQKIGGLDENIRYENDRDFFLRAIDQAGLIKYHPSFVARHNIPDPRQKKNASTAVSYFEKRIDQLRVLDKAILFGNHLSLREHGRRHKVYTLKKIAEELAKERRYRDASYYAFEALLIGYGWRWLGFIAWNAMQRAWRSDRDAERRK